MYLVRMQPNDYHPKPGDRIVRPGRIKRYHLKRVLGIAGLFSAGYGDVGSSIYYGLGVVAIAALGFTPIALIIAGIIYIFNALSYAEGGAMIPESGGSASFARRGYNDMVGFAAGWGLMLSYIVTMAISAYTIPPYLGYFWPVLDNKIVGTGVAIGIILFLMTVNVLGVRESSRLNIIFITIDIGTQISLIVLGLMFILLPEPRRLIMNMFGSGNMPTAGNFVYGIAIAALCFTGVETVSQLAEETRRPAERVPRTYVIMIFVVMIIFAGISITALAAMTPQLLGDPINGWARDPVAGIAANLPSEQLRNIFAPLVSVLAASILLTATNAGLLGISRLAFNLSSHQQLPGALARIHHRFRTPYITIIMFCLVSMCLLVPGFFSGTFFTELGALYVFGSLLVFAIAHASILALRVREPDTPRPFYLKGSVSIKGRKLPVTALLGLTATSAIWIFIMVAQPFSRWGGLAWMAVGILIYFIYRRRHRIPLTRRVTPSKPTRDFR